MTLVEASQQKPCSAGGQAELLQSFHRDRRCESWFTKHTRVHLCYNIYAILTASETLSPPTIEPSCIRGLLTLCQHTHTHTHTHTHSQQ